MIGDLLPNTIERLREWIARPQLPERPAEDGINEWLFVTAEDSRGWILDAICREIGSRQSGSWQVVYGTKIVLPPARTYFFSHYRLYLDHLRRNPHIVNGRILVWYTHPRDLPFSVEEQIEGYCKATRIVFTCSQFRDAQIAVGLPPARTSVVLGAADPRLFIGHRRGGGVIGLSSAFYARKCPDTLLDLVRLLQHRRFQLIGRGWEAYERFDELIGSPNFEYVTAAYTDYPGLYAGFDVFLSLATLEGGPIPLVESMMSNVVPVASRTGFAPDLIDHGANGFLFDIGTPAADIAPLIEQALALDANVRATVRRYTWAAFAREMHAIAREG